MIMKSTLSQRLKVIAANKFKSDSATSRIILEAAEFIEKHERQDDREIERDRPNNAYEYNFYFSPVLGSVRVFSFIPSKNLFKLSKIYKKIKDICDSLNVKIINISTIGLFEFRIYLSHETSELSLESCERYLKSMSDNIY